MVLLTSSAVSVIISSGIICTFTILLFLSGYVLQQQTVHALQDALRQPPAPRPIPTLPAKFRHQENETLNILVDDQDVSFEVGKEDMSAGQVAMEVPRRPDDDDDEEEIEVTLRLAYIFALKHPSDLCSALLFTNQQRQATRFRYKPATILLYPTTWETVSKPIHTAVLTYMRQIQDRYNLIYHPVQIDPTLDLTAQLLGKLQWKRWDYDRALYLRSPGYALDIGMLDAALSQSKMGKAWAPLNTATGSDPNVLLYTPEKGLMAPRKEMRKLTSSVSVSVSHPHGHDEEREHLSEAKRAGYLVFDEPAVGSRRDVNSWFMDVFDQFDRERHSVCASTGLLHSDDRRGSRSG